MRMVKRLAAFMVMLACLLCCAAFALAEPVVVSDVETVVDFELIEQLNPECVGWIYHAESGINLPVMQNENDDWYRERGFDQVKIYKTGSAFISHKQTMDAPVLTVRGQARTEGCFDAVTDWRDAETAAQYGAFRILTPEGDWEAEVFACIEIEQRDMDKWDPSRADADFDAWLQDVRKTSLWPVNEANLPQAEDRMLYVAGLHLSGKCTLVMARMSPIVYDAPETVVLHKKALDEVESVSGMVDAGPAGELMYYAQNDPVYADMRYESALRSDSYRDFGGGGCGPTAMAIIVANLVEKEDLPLIGQHAKTELGNLFCACSVNRVYCDHTHVPYPLKTADEYLRYLPVAMGDFAAGNNEYDLVARRVKNQGTNIVFTDYITEIYGLARTPVSTLDEAFALVRENPGEGLVLVSALAGSAMTNSSHFIVLTGVDDEYFYMLDPMYRTAEKYKSTDKRRVIDVVQPGVVRVKLENAYRSDLVPVAYFTAGE